MIACICAGTWQGRSRQDVGRRCRLKPISQEADNCFRISLRSLPRHIICHRQIKTDLLFNHSFRVFFFGAIAGRQRGLTFAPELLYFWSFECMIAAVTMPPILFVAFSSLFSQPRCMPGFMPRHASISWIFACADGGAGHALAST